VIDWNLPLVAKVIWRGDAYTAARRINSSKVAMSRLRQAIANGDDTFAEAIAYQATTKYWFDVLDVFLTDASQQSSVCRP
jgi:hypothetical protein